MKAELYCRTYKQWLLDPSLCLNEWQTFLAGFLTSATAIISVIVLLRQIKTSKDLYTDNLNRQQNLLRLKFIPHTRKLISHFNLYCKIIPLLLNYFDKEREITSDRPNENFSRYIVKNSEAIFENFHKYANLCNSKEEYKFIGRVQRFIINSNSSLENHLNIGMFSKENLSWHFIKSVTSIKILSQIEQYCMDSDLTKMPFDNAITPEEEWNQIKALIDHGMKYHQHRDEFKKLIDDMIDIAISHNTRPIDIAS